MYIYIYIYIHICIYTYIHIYIYIYSPLAIGAWLNQGCGLPTAVHDPGPGGWSTHGPWVDRPPGLGKPWVDHHPWPGLGQSPLANGE